VAEPAAVIAEQPVGFGGELQGAAIDRPPAITIATETRMVGVPGEVVTDEQVQVAVAVEIGERGRRRPTALPAQIRRLGDLLKAAVAPVAVEGVAAPAGDEQVGITAVVIVSDGHAVTVAPRYCGDT